MDIETIVRDLGHNVTGVAVTRDEAVTQARQHPPGLVLAHIQLADDSSGIDAVKDLLAETGTRVWGPPSETHFPHRQAVPAVDGEGGHRAGFVLRRGNRSCLRSSRNACGTWA